MFSLSPSINANFKGSFLKTPNEKFWDLNNF